NYINIGLMIVSCMISFFVPFELFLFSYGVLGPLHYLTEIGWLHKKNYFTRGKYDFVFLVALCCGLYYYIYINPPKNSDRVADLIILGVFLAFIFVFIKDWLYRIAAALLAIIAIGVLNDQPNYFIWIGIFL